MERKSLGTLSLAAAPDWVQPFFYRSSAEAEVDLILEMTPTRRWAIEIKRSISVPKPRRGFYLACDELEVERRLVVYAGTRALPQSRGVETLPLLQAMRELRES